MKTTFLIILALAISTVSFSQDDVIVINKSDLRSKTKRERIRTDNIQVFKFAPLNMITGEINFGYERMMTENSSFDIELGPTISEIGFGVDYHYYDPYYAYSSNSSGMGFVTSFAYRYYPSDDYFALNGFYVSPKIRYKMKNSFVVPSQGVELDRERESVGKVGFYFDFGYQIWLSSTFSIDFYSGLGIGFISGNQFQMQSVWNGTDYDYTWEEYKYSDAIYMFNAGIKVGIGSK